jgi:hypothetical protein
VLQGIIHRKASTRASNVASPPETRPLTHARERDSGAPATPHTPPSADRRPREERESRQSAGAVHDAVLAFSRNGVWLGAAAAGKAGFLTAGSETTWSGVRGMGFPAPNVGKTQRARPAFVLDAWGLM